MNFQSHRNILSHAPESSHKGIWTSVKRLFPVLLYAMPFTAMAQMAETTTDSIKNGSRKVNIAYGTQTEDQVTSSISRISSEELRKTHTATLSNALIGRLPGLTVQHNGGSPGFDDPAVSIRGRHTTQNNGQLILIDGIQINSLSNISVDEIESVSVLKDAAALALYGVKGANGVLLVTTKRGVASDKIKISLNARYGLQAPTILPKFAGSYDYARLYNQARLNDGLQPAYTQTQLNGYLSATDPYLYPNVNWYDEVLRNNSPMQDYSLTFNGGSDNTKYFVMLGYMDNQGLYANTDQENNSNINFKRLNFRSNVDLTITKAFSAKIGLGGNIQDRKFPPISTEDLWRNMATYAPNLYSVRTPDGKITGTTSFPINPVGYLLEKGYQSRHDRNIQSSVRLDHKLNFITNGLNAFAGIMFDNEFNSRYDKTRNYAYYQPVEDFSGEEPSVSYLERGLNSDLLVTTGNNYENNRIIFQGGLDYNRSFNSHNLGGMLMYQQDQYTVLGNQSSFAMQNLSGRFMYNFREKYFAEAVFSYSGTENYAPGRRFGFFPAISAGWLIHKEDFWNKNSSFNYLKLRASAGVVGNDRGASRFNYNQYWGTQSNQGYYFGTGQAYKNALVELGIANPDITWEKARILNFGLETALWNNKLSFSADLFHENRHDILVNTGNVIPSMSGLASPALTNAGRVINYGTEVAAMFKNSSKAFNYFLGGQFSFARNKVKENYEVPVKEAYSSRRNRPVSQYFGLEAIGYFKNESDIISSPQQTFAIVKPGDLKYKDQNNDGVIDINDEIAIGRHSYPEISYSFNTGAGYKGFNLELFFQGMANRSVYLNGYMFQPFANDANISTWAMEGHWTPETHAAATFPRLTTEPNANNYRASTFWVRNANLLRLRNVELSYALPQNALNKIHVQGLKIFVSGLNLITWDDLDVDVDPETLSTGYPVIKTYTVGLNVKF